MSESEQGCFQETVSEYLIRHRSILDVLSKFQESGARVNRAVAKAVTECGCLKISACRQEAPDGAGFRDLKSYMASHLAGELCDSCADVLEAELGRTLFYLTALCDLTGLNLEDVMEKERRRVAALGPFSLT